MDWITDYYNWRVVIQFIPEFRDGILATLYISLISLILALVIGTVVAIMRMSSKTGGVAYRGRLCAGHSIHPAADPDIFDLFQPASTAAA